MGASSRAPTATLAQRVDGATTTAGALVGAGCGVLSMAVMPAFGATGGAGTVGGFERESDEHGGRLGPFGAVARRVPILSGLTEGADFESISEIRDAWEIHTSSRRHLAAAQRWQKRRQHRLAARTLTVDFDGNVRRHVRNNDQSPK